MYYDGTKLLSLKDLAGNLPEIYMCVGNRTAGKTVFFKRLLINNFLKYGKKFVMLYRFNYELSACADMIFTDIEPLFFQGMEMTSESVAKGLFYKLLLNEKECGFAVALSNADAIKKYSSFFIDVENVFFDEFQSETNHYCQDELKKFQSIHYSIARGHGKQYRYVRTFMASNSISIINPYFVGMGVHKRLRNNTNYLKGGGWVLEQTFNESASESIKQSGFNQAFSDNYGDYASQNVYLNDNSAFITKLTGKFRYMGTIKHNDKFYGIRDFSEHRLVYINTKHDESFPFTMVINSNQHDENLMMVDKSAPLMIYLKKAFEYGMLRFEDLECKNMLLDLLTLK